MKTLLVLASLLISTHGFAQQITVEKVKGNKAVVNFTGFLEQGKTYTIGGSANAPTTKPPGTESRAHLLSGTIDFFSGTDTTQVSGASLASGASVLSLTTRFGWNFEKYEVGPILSYRAVDSDFQSLHTTVISAGGFADYNFTPNQPGDNILIALTGEATYGTYTPKSGTAGSALGGFAGGSLKWFGLTSTTAIRTDFGYSYQKITTGGANVTSAGFAIRAGIMTYF